MDYFTGQTFIYAIYYFLGYATFTETYFCGEDGINKGSILL